MNKGFTFSLGLLFALTPCHINATAGKAILPLSQHGMFDSAKFYALGKTTGKNMIDRWWHNLNGIETEVEAADIPGLSKELYAVLNVLEKNDSKTPSYKNAFQAIRSYYQGLKEVLNELSIEKFCDNPELINPPLQANIKKEYELTLKVAEAFSAASTYQAAIQSVIQIMNNILEPASASVENACKEVEDVPLFDIRMLSEKELLLNEHYKAGLTSGADTAKMLLLTIQGKEVPYEQMLAGVNKTFADLMPTLSAANRDVGSEGFQNALTSVRLFLLGLIKEVEKVDIEKLFIQYKTNEKEVKKTRLHYKLLTQGFKPLIYARTFHELGRATMEMATSSLQEAAELNAEIRT